MDRRLRLGQGGQGDRDSQSSVRAGLWETRRVTTAAHDASDIADIELAPVGHQAIEWAREHSPLVDGFLRDRLKDGVLEGKTVALVVHLEAKTALLGTVLADAGARVVAAGSNPFSTRDEVCAALVERGIEVHSTRESGYPAWEKHLMAVADAGPDLIIDDGAELTVRMARHRRDQFMALEGVTEQTTTGVQRLRQIDEEIGLPFPAMGANTAACKHLFDNKYGTGQSTIQAMLNLTNMLMPGKRVAIVGYGFVGRGLAQYVRAMGGTPVVVEVDPVRALEAHMDGAVVAPIAEALAQADMAITATGGMRAIARRHFEHLRDGVILANAGHHDLEIDVEALATAADRVDEVRAGITRYQLGDRRIDVLASGALVNIAGGLGHPIEIMDLSFAVQGVGCHELARGGYDNGLHVISEELDAEIAAAKLSSFGITLDQLDADQLDRVELDAL